MKRGISLVELMISMTIASVLILALYSMNTLSATTYSEIRSSWYCLQSIRNTLLQIDRDLMQCAYLLPQDLKISITENILFIAGVPVTSSHPGLGLSNNTAPPYFSIVTEAQGSGLRVDTADIDTDNRPDYWADLGLISDSGSGIISHGYSRGNTLIPVTSQPTAKIGDRIIPAIHYELRPGGLHRNSQLIAEAITTFNASMNGKVLTIYLEAFHDGVQKKIHYPYVIQ